MHTAQYTIGLDYGTLSARAALVSVTDGTEIASYTFTYPHGVMERRLPDGTPLGHDWALQHPADYTDALAALIPAVLKAANVSGEQVVGIGIDFTASTVMPVLQDGTPLCLLPEYAGNPHAYVKLWKHHAAQPYATRMEKRAIERGEAFLGDYGGKLSSEWLFPKLWQVLAEAPDIYDTMACWIEAADWLVWQMTGVQARNTCCAGYKACYGGDRGYPSPDYLGSLDARLRDAVQTKLNAPVIASGEKAGGLTDATAEALGLRPGTAVAAPFIDAHVAVAAAGIDRPGIMMGILGTSACYMLLGDTSIQVPGICGVVKDGIMPGFYGYEAGLAGMGDLYAWVVDNLVGGDEREKAAELGMNLHAYLTEQAGALQPGQSGLIALDWLNGNRSTLVDAELTGMLLGMTLQTTSAEIYRAFLEATAYATRHILNTFTENGVAIDAFYVTGGISQKNRLAMQILADVLDMPVRVVNAPEGGALGSAIFGAYAGGAYPTIQEATGAMGRKEAVDVLPIAENVAVYAKLFAEYITLYRYFGAGGNDVMKRLLAMKKG